MYIIETQEDMDNRDWKDATVHFLIEKESWMRGTSFELGYPKPQCGQLAACYATKETKFVNCIKCRRNIGLMHRPPTYPRR